MCGFRAVGRSQCKRLGHEFMQQEGSQSSKDSYTGVDTSWLEYALVLSPTKCSSWAVVQEIQGRLVGFWPFR